MENVGNIFGLAALGATCVFVVAIFRAKMRIAVAAAFCVAAGVVMWATSSAPPSTDTAAAASTGDSRTRAEQKRDFLKGVDESISGARIVGNPYKFVGDDVDIRCVVDNVPSPGFINATCPPDQFGVGPAIVVEADTSNIEEHQHIRVMGTVESPITAKNGFGADADFPTVKAEFME